MVTNVANPATFVLNGGLLVTGTRQKKPRASYFRERAHPSHTERVVEVMAIAQQDGPLPPPKPLARRLNVIAFYQKMTGDGTKVLD